MGKLLALELFNFKSYKGHHVLQFGDSYFTSIIGPNGSGKSNSMDAISFVLGIKSSHLRSTHLKDLVYRGRVLKHSTINADGTATDAANGDGPRDEEGGASDDGPETQTTSRRNEPQTAWVMAVYEDDAGEEQRWRRSITSSGHSEYRINNRVVAAKEYNESLETENILIKARNFLVFQGDIEAIASQNPKDITRLIEQISGSLEYKSEYERLKAEKEKSDEDQADKLQLRRGINGEIKQFRQQKEELDRFETLRGDKDQAIINQILWKLFHFQRTIEDSTAEIQKHQDELKEFRRNVQKFEDKLDEAKRAQANAGRDVNKLERGIKQKERVVDEKENALVPMDEKLHIYSQNLNKYRKRLDEIGKDRDSQHSFAEKLRSDLSTVQKAKKRWEDEWQAQQRQAGRQLRDEDLQEYERLRGEVYKRSGSDQIKVDNITRQLKTDEETVGSLKSKLDSTQAQVNALEAETNGLTERRVDIASNAKSTTKEIDVKKRAIDGLISERERTRQKYDELREKLDQVSRQLEEAQGAQRESQKEAHQRELVAQLKRIFPGVKGMVHQLCKPTQKKYETAVATVLGRHFDALVVDTEKTAKDCIDHLKAQRAGVLNFIPLDTIIHRQPDVNFHGMQQGARLAIKTVEYDTNLERAMSYAFGNAIVTDNVKTAKILCYEKRVDAKAVTLDGTIIHKGGNMTGGEGPNDKKRRFEDAEVENLRNLAAKFVADIEALPKGRKRQTEEEQLQSELSGLETKMNYAQNELKALDHNIDSKRKELKFARSQLTEIGPRYEKESQGLESLRRSLEENTASIAEVEDEVFGAFCQRLGYGSIRDYEKLQGTVQQEANKKKQEFNSQISRLENQVVSETHRLQSTEDRILRMDKDMKRDQDLGAQLEAQTNELRGELDELGGEIEQLEEQLVRLRGQYEERGKKVSEAKAEVQKRSKSVEKTLKEASALEAMMQKASADRYGILRQCKVENINIPLERGSRKIDALPLEDAILEQDEDAMDVDGEEGNARARADDYGILVDFAQLSDELKEDDSDECDANLAEKTNAITAELDKMAPNMRSAERLEQTLERLQGTDREFNESRSAARKSTKAFEDVKLKRMDLFNGAFAHISDQIGAVYKELTKTASFPLGGSATLSVEDDDEPYLGGIKYSAMPPLKRFRDMEHLSGGEKTMAALALLFAVHAYAPSPFFVLDEVDAALDNANTAQLANYVREHAGPGMQFVVISLKTGLFQESETLVGIMRDQGVNSSKALTLDLRKYQAVA